MSWLSLLCILASGPATAQERPPSTPPAGAPSPPSPPGVDPGATTLEDVIVARRRGAADLAPDQEWSAGDIDGLAAWDIGEAVGRISETLGLDAPPVLLINGRRTVDPRNFLGFPPDAMIRIEALPPEAGAIYGGDPSRRVLNIVLQPEFRSRDGRIDAARPTAGGRSSLLLDGRQSGIQEMDTMQVGAQVSRTTALRGDERAAYRRDHPGRDAATLRPAVDALTINLARTGAIGDWTGAFGLNGQAQRTRFTALVAGRADRTTQTALDLAVNAGAGGQALGWSVRLGLDGAASRTEQDGPAPLRARTLSMIGSLTADRSLLDLPAGPLQAAVSGQYLQSRTVAETATLTTRQSARALDLNGSLTAPLFQADGEDGAGRTVGDLSLSLGGRIRALDTAAAGSGAINAGLSWGPDPRVRVSAQWSRASDGPTREQRLDPILYGPPRTVYDFRTGQSVDVLLLSGGNPDLLAQNTESADVSITLGPFGAWGLRANLGLHRDVATNGIGALPGLTPATEAAFPDRFVRDVDGRLISIDQRPINLDATRVETVSSGLVLNIPIRVGAGDAARVGALQVALGHSWQRANLVTLRPDLPALDRLAGDGGGIPRHQLNLRLDGRYRTWGVSAIANWRSGSRSRRDLGIDSPADLRLEPFASVDLKVNYRVERTPDTIVDGGRRDPGLRLGLEIDNLFDARPRAFIGHAVAPGYGRDDQDPLGRVVRLTLTRRF
ncbi:MAG: TonB-dependent receptor [Brevundimonas sp.]|nr:MAG: TonB-dependent receptor [Brevundimonas sp.]